MVASAVWREIAQALASSLQGQRLMRRCLEIMRHADVHGCCADWRTWEEPAVRFLPLMHSSVVNTAPLVNGLT